MLQLQLSFPFISTNFREWKLFSRTPLTQFIRFSFLCVSVLLCVFDYYFASENSIRESFYQLSAYVLLVAKHPYKRRLRFNGHGRSFDVTLHQSDVIPEKLKVISQDHNDVGESYVVRDHPVENRFYHGRLRDDENEPIIGSGVMNSQGFKGERDVLLFYTG